MIINNDKYLSSSLSTTVEGLSVSHSQFWVHTNNYNKSRSIGIFPCNLSSNCNRTNDSCFSQQLPQRCRSPAKIPSTSICYFTFPSSIPLPSGTGSAFRLRTLFLPGVYINDVITNVILSTATFPKLWHLPGTNKKIAQTFPKRTITHCTTHMVRRYIHVFFK